MTVKIRGHDFDANNPKSIVALINDMGMWIQRRQAKELGTGTLECAIFALTHHLDNLGFKIHDKQVVKLPLLKAQETGPGGWGTQNPVEAIHLLEYEVERLQRLQHRLYSGITD